MPTGQTNRAGGSLQSRGVHPFPTRLPWGPGCGAGGKAKGVGTLTGTGGHPRAVASLSPSRLLRGFGPVPSHRWGFKSVCKCLVGADVGGGASVLRQALGDQGQQEGAPSSPPSVHLLTAVGRAPGAGRCQGCGLLGDSLEAFSHVKRKFITCTNMSAPDPENRAMCAPGVCARCPQLRPHAALTRQPRARGTRGPRG